MTWKERLAQKDALLLDGGMGTCLMQAGLKPGGAANTTHPDVVESVHRAYVEAGASVLLTNTLTLNRVSQELHEPDVPLESANREAVAAARRAIPATGWILGDVGPTGKLLEPLGDLPRSTAYAAFYEQARLLVDAGVDGLIIETMYALAEAECALEACIDAADLPVIVCLAFTTSQNSGRTVMGDSGADLAVMAERCGAAAVGANCGTLSPEEMAEIVGFLRQYTRLPIVIQPNAGKPKTREESTYYDMEPEAFAEGITACLEAGAQLVGGCCGTTPEHIRAAAAALLAHKQ